MRPDFELLPWIDVAADDRAAWRELRDARPGLRSPYFDLAWFDAVARVRRDVMVIKASVSGGATGFLALHRPGFGLATPVGGPFSDWHGVVGDLDLPAALRALGLPGFAFHGAPASDAALSGFANSLAASHLIDLSSGYGAWRAARGRALHGLDRHIRKLAKDGHGAEFTFDDQSPAAFEQLLAWKSEQFRETGQFDQLSLTWTRDLLSQVRTLSEPGLRGLVSTLKIDGALAAVHLGMISGPVLHYWFPAFNRAVARFAPGSLLLDALAREAAAQGITEIDLGKGEYRYKQEFANAQAPLIEGIATGSHILGRAHRAARALIDRTARLPIGPAARLPQRAFRRLSRDAALRKGEAAVDLRPSRPSTPPQ